MKKVSTFLFVLLIGIGFNAFAQTTPPTDFFAGKWDMVVTGTPNGDTKMTTELVRKDGKLTGQLKATSGSSTDPVPITKVEEAADKITIYFESAQAGEIAIALTKVDDDHLKGSLMDMFDTTAVRIK